MCQNALQPNEAKTKFIVFSRSNPIPEQELIINGTTLKSTNSIKHVTLDSAMCLEQQVTNTCRVASYHLRRIRYIQRYLKTLVEATVLARLDYANSLYNGLP